MMVLNSDGKPMTHAMSFLAYVVSWPLDIAWEAPSHVGSGATQKHARMRHAFPLFSETQDNSPKFPSLMWPGTATARHFFLGDKLKNIYNYVFICLFIYFMCHPPHYPKRIFFMNYFSLVCMWHTKIGHFLNFWHTGPKGFTIPALKGTYVEYPAHSLNCYLKILWIFIIFIIHQYLLHSANHLVNILQSAVKNFPTFKVLAL